MRRPSYSCIGFIAALLLSVGGAMAAFAAAPSITTTIQPAEIAVGESAQMVVTSNGSLPQMTMPNVPGLQFRYAGQSQQIQMINGVTLATTSVIFRVTAQTAGIFTIPSITPNSQPVVLRVSPAGSANNAIPSVPSVPSVPSAAPGLPQAPALRSSDSGIHLTPDGSAFMKLDLPKHDIYVGESVPVVIEVGLRDGFVSSLNGLPTPTGGDFTLNNLSHAPERVQRMIDGKPFTVLTWHSILAAIKPGTFTLTMETPLTVRVRTRPQRESMIDDMLGDPFLQNFFGATVPKDIVVASPPAEFNVLALPTEGRPADYSGAVGNFKMTAELSSKTAAAGDPLTLRMHVTGAGNFDRVESSMLDAVDHWKTYQPKATFNPSDPTGYHGEKIFEQPVIAGDTGEQTLPGLSFSFFNATTHHYETLHSPPLTVNIAAPASEAQANAARVAKDGGAPLGPATGTDSSLKPDHPDTGVTASLLPLYFRPLFAGAAGALAVLFAGAWMGLYLRDRAQSNARSRVALRSVDEVLEELQDAAGAGDTLRFFNTARAALRDTLAARWNVDPDTIATTDIDERVGNDADDVRQIFSIAEEANYAGGAVHVDNFQRWMHVVRQQLVQEVAQ